MPDEGIFVTKTKNPWGEWSKPHAIFEGKGWIDPCPFWDDDGRAYMVSAFAKSRIGFKSILHLTEMKPDCSALLDEGQHVFDGNENGQSTIEGPKLYKRNGYYYIMAPAGGVKPGWQVVMRSKNIWGPYEYKMCLFRETQRLMDLIRAHGLTHRPERIISFISGCVCSGKNCPPAACQVD